MFDEINRPMEGNIIIAPYSKPLRNGMENAKNYPYKYWIKVIKNLDKDFQIIQLTYHGERPLVDYVHPYSYEIATRMVKSCVTWISVDTYLQHLGWKLGKPGVVIFGQGDPNIFGHDTNINLLKSRKYLRDNQFGDWESAAYKEEAFVEPEKVIEAVRNLVEDIKTFTLRQIRDGINKNVSDEDEQIWLPAT